ncbi:MAG TPA: SpoIIE family protein phosphatase, partial [Solirubrobacteraceae bacterium]
MGTIRPSGGDEDRTAAAAGVLFCTVVAVVDLAVDGSTALSPLLALGPLVTAALRGGTRATAAVASIAAGLAVAAAMLDHDQAWADHAVALVVVAGGGALATLGAALRERAGGLVADLTRAEGQLDTILANLGEAVIVRAPDGSIAYANPAAADLLGLGSPEQLKATPATEITRRFDHMDEHGVPLDESWSLSARALAGETPPPLLVHRIDRATGHERWLMQKATPVRDAHGRVVLAVSVFEDVTAVRRTERHQRLLAEASKLITSSLDVAATLEKTAWALVPDVADWVIVDLPDERRGTQPAAIAHVDTHRRELLRELRDAYPPARDDPSPAGVMRDGRSLLVPNVEDADMLAYARDERHLELMRQIGTRSVAAVPMPGAERIVGTITLGTAESGRVLGEDELVLAEELGARAAIAIENAREHADRSYIARTLQRSLLPPRLPQIPGITLAARFRAAGGTSDVGGDFYDLFAVDEGWMVVVGDVTGKGPVAAALTSLVRYTIRTAATYERSPAAALERLNAVLVTDPDRRQLCTAVCARVRPRGDGDGVDVEVARGGHPPPYLVCPGRPAAP